MSQNGNKNSNQPVGPFPADFSREEQSGAEPTNSMVERVGKAVTRWMTGFGPKRELET